MVEIKSCSISRFIFDLDDHNSPQLFPHEGQLPHVLLRPESDVVEKLAHFSRAEPPPLPQHDLGHGNLRVRAVL